MFLRKIFCTSLLVLFMAQAVQTQVASFSFLGAKWQPDGNYIAIEGEDQILVLDTNLSEIITLNPEPLPEEMTDARILDTEWSPDGSKLAATVFSSANELQSTRLIIWDSNTWQITNELFNAVNEVNFSPNSQYIATQVGYDVVIYDIGQEVVANQFQFYRPSSMVWNPIDINEMAVGRDSSNPNGIVILNPFTGDILQELPYSYGFTPSYSPDGAFLALGRFEETGVTVVDVLDTTTYSVISSLPHENGLYEGKSIYWLGNNEIGTGSFLGEALRWNALTGEQTNLAGLSERSQVYWKSDGSLFIAKGLDSLSNEAIYLYNGYTGEIVSQLIDTNNPYIQTITLKDASTEEHLFSLSNGTIIEIADIETMPAALRAHTHPQMVGSVKFELSGSATVSFTDDTLPYELGWTATAGSYTLSATPYSGANGTGTAGTPHTVNFTVRQPRILYIHNGKIYSMNYDGTDSRLLVTGGSPAWSPDGTRIAYWGNSGTGREIFVMNADGSNQTRLTYNNANDLNPSWSPDGNRIVYDSVVTGSDREIYIMNADGSNPVNITNNSVDDFDPTWSPAGDWIAFSSQAGDEDQIFTMRTNGNQRTRLTVSENNLVSPNWSPDGTMIVYTKLRTNTDIYRMNADGSGGLRLTTNAATDQSPSWSADGSRILFSSLRNPGNNNYFELYWMNANGTQETRLTNTPNVNEIAGVPAYP